MFVVSILNWIGRGSLREKDLIISASEKSSLLSVACCGCWRSRRGDECLRVSVCVCLRKKRGEREIE